LAFVDNAVFLIEEAIAGLLVVVGVFEYLRDPAVSQVVLGQAQFFVHFLVGRVFHFLAGLDVAADRNVQVQRRVALGSASDLQDHRLKAAALPFEQYEEAVQMLFDRKALKVAMYPG